MRVLYLDASYGLSGDMAVAAVAALCPKEVQTRVLDTLNHLGLEGLHCTLGTRRRGALSCTDFDVQLACNNHDHDMEYLHGHSHPHEHGHDHEHMHEHEHEHEHGHHHAHVHRNLHDVTAILSAAAIPEEARALATRIFTIVAKAEAKAHGLPLEEVHFHEVGALDSIADILAFSLFYTALKVDKTVLTALTEGTGSVRCQHGVLPVPVPAVVNIMVDNALPVRFSGIEGELITPTGAAIAAAIRSPDTALDTSLSTVIAVGYGAGKREYSVPTFVRALLLDTEAEDVPTQGLPGERTIVKMECNVDDSTPELLGHLMEELFKAGALDVSFTPCYMKKLRPGTTISVICEDDTLETLRATLFSQSTTIGVRYTTWQRTVLPRESLTLNSPLGALKCKKVTLEGPDRRRLTRYYPEYESVKALAQANSLALPDALSRVTAFLSTL